jgi:hypothetical protein
MMQGNDKGRESRLRVLAERQGLRLMRSSRYDGGYQLVDRHNRLVAGWGGDVGHGYCLDLDAVEKFLRAERCKSR